MVNPGTFLIIALIIIQGFYCHNLKQFSTLLFLGALGSALLIEGYFIKIGSLYLTYEEVMTLFFLTSWFLNSGLYHIDKKVLLKGIILINVTIIGIYLLITFPKPNTMVVPIGASWDAYYAGITQMKPLSFSSNNSERVFRLILFVMIGLSVKNFLKSNKNLILKALLYFTAAQVLIGYLDLFSKLLLSRPVIPNFRIVIFGTEFSENVNLYFRAGLPTIQGLMGEPSHFAYSFIPGLTILALSKNKNLTLVIIEFLSILILFLSGSFAGFSIILYWFLLHAYKIVMSSKLGKMLSLVLIIVIFILGIVVIQTLANSFPIIDYYVSRFYGLLGIGPSIGSESIRLMSINYSFKWFAEYPFFGIGLGSSIAHGFIPNLLANMGIIGFFSWIAFSFDAFYIDYKKLRNLIVIFILFFIMVFTGDIGWTYNMMGIAMLVGLSVSLQMLSEFDKEKNVK
jgi:hypothetical protein